MAEKSFAELNAERLKTALELGQPDQVPVAIPVMGWWSTAYIGVKQMREYYMNPKVMLEAQQAVNKRFRDIVGYWPDFGVVLEVSGIGAKIRFPENESPWVDEPVVKVPENIDKLRVPDVHKDGLFPQFWKTWDYMASHGCDPSTGLFYTDGPIDKAAMLRGVTQIMNDIVQSPDLVHKILRITAETSIEYFKAIEQKVGGLPGNALQVADDLSGFLSPKSFREFHMNYAKRIYDSFSSEYSRHWHSDSERVMNVAHLLPEMGVKAFWYPSYRIDIAEMKQKIGDKICLIGNVDCLDVLLRGTAQDVEKASRECIKKAARNGAYVLGPGGEVIRGIPPGNVDALIDSSIKYGKYPIET